MISLHYVPLVFTRSFLLPIPKSWSEDICQIPEALQLHRFVAKMFEYVLHKGFLDGIEGKTHYLQGEFRKGYGTSHTSCILQEAVLACRSQNQRAFLDVWHQGLFVILHQYGLTNDL